MRGGGDRRISVCAPARQATTPYRRRLATVRGLHTALSNVRGIPILLNEDASVFRIADYVAGAPYTGASGYTGNADLFRRAYRRMAHALSEHSVKHNRLGPNDV